MILIITAGVAAVSTQVTDEGDVHVSEMGGGQDKVPQPVRDKPNLDPRLRLQAGALYL